MTQTPEIVAELQFAQTAIHDYLHIFEQHGFSSLGTEIDRSSKLTADTAVFTFRNEISGIQIEVAFAPPFRDIRRMFIVTIINSRRLGSI